MTENKKVKFEMESGGSFVVELYPEYAPKTAENFLKLVESDFYSGLNFHRIVEGFMAQGGAPAGGKEAGAIFGEFKSNGFAQNTLSHTRGVISMARTNAPNSASSQFFICYADATFLDGGYAAFGKVVEGMETVDAFLEIERSFNGMDSTPASPVQPIIIKKANVL